MNMLHPYPFKTPTAFEALAGYLFVVSTIVIQWNAPNPEPEMVQSAFFTMLVIGLLISAATTILSELLRPKQDIENAKPAAAGDFKFPTAVEGRVIPIIWGEVKLSGPNVTWWGDFRQVPVKEKVKTGLWSKKRVITGYQYFFGMDMAICRGGTFPIALEKVLIGEKEVAFTSTEINEPELFGGNKFGTGGMVGDIEFFPGSTTQVASAYLDTFQTPISGQRGTAHMVWEGGFIGTTTQVKAWSFVCSRYPSSLLTEATAAGQAGSYGGTDNIVNDFDVNPMEVIFEAIRDDDWGMGKPNSAINMANFAEAASVLKSADESNGFAFQMEQGMDILELLELVMEQIDGVLYLDRITGKYNIRLARQDYTVNHGVSSISGTNTYNLNLTGGTEFTAGQTMFADGFDQPGNNGRKTVVSSTDFTVVVSETLVDEPTPGAAFGGPRISEINGITATNSIDVKEFSRETWDGTTNQIRIGFADRSREYFDTFARADSLSNQRMQNGEIVTATLNFPGVKNATLANALASRELRALSFPLSTSTHLVNRDFWDAQPGEPVRWTNENLGFIDLVVRLTRVDFGDTAGNITLGAVQDIFALESGFFGNPPLPLWTLPTQGVAEIAIDQHRVFEAPKAIVDRDPLYPNLPDRVFVGARAQAGETAIEIWQRNVSGSFTSEVFAVDGHNEGLFLIGSLNEVLTASDANPTAGIQLSDSPDSFARVNFSFDSEGATAAEIGQQLANFIMIGDEFIGVEGFQDDGAGLYSFTTCYRGLLDSVPAAHSISDSVYLLYVSGGLNDTTIPPLNNVEVQPRTVSRDETMTAIQAKTFAFQMTNRYRRPYAPPSMTVNAVLLGSTPSLDFSASNDDGDDQGIEVEWIRRSFETIDEVESLTVDAATLEAGFQAKNNHLSQVSATVVDDDSIVISAFNGGFDDIVVDVISRADAIWATDGEVPSTLTVSLKSKHTVDTIDYESLNTLEVDTAPTSAELDALDNLGTVFANGPVSKTFIAASTGTPGLTGDSAISGIQYNYNESGWAAIAGLSGETIALTDELEFRHTDTGESPLNAVHILTIAMVDVAYVVFNTSTEYDGLVGYWNMNESSGNRLARFGGSTEFTDNNTCPSGTGQFDLAVQCTDGTSDATVEHLTIPSANALRKGLFPTGAEDFTITCWFKLPVGGASAKPAQIVWQMADWSTGGVFLNRKIDFRNLSSGVFQFVTVSTSGVVSVAAVNLGGTAGSDNEDKWVFAAVTVSSGTMTGYLKDGTSTSSGNGDNPVGILRTTDQPISIGGAYLASAIRTQYSMEEMLFDEFRIYRGRALSEAELDDLVEATQPLS